MARKLALTAPERASAIVNTFTKDLASASSYDAKRQLLLALGNAGAPDSLVSIELFTEDKDPDLRGVAIRALRFINTGRVEELLLHALSSDENISVRKEALYSLGFREMTKAAFKSQQEVFQKESDMSIRLQILQNLWKAREAFPEVRHLVKKASKDPSKEIQKAAADIMAKYPKTYFK
jgi:HEAT repeat protein